MKLQRIVELFRWLYDSTIDTPVRSTIRYIFSLFTSFVRRHKKWTTIQKESTSEARPTNDFKDHQAGPAFETAPPFHSLESVVSASNIPVPAHETVLSSSSQDVRASSIHSDASAQRFLQVPVINSRPVMQPNSSDGQTPGSSPPSPQGQLSVSRPISSYAKKNGSVSQNSMHSSTAINRELSEEGVETVSIHTSPEVPVDPPFTPGMMQLSEVHERFLPIVPELYPRYERTTYVPAQRNTYILAPQTTSFGPEKAIPAGWERKVHPEGACYWVYGDGTYYTESDLMDDLTRTRIMDCINDFDDFTRSRSIQLTPLRTNIVLSLRSDPDDPNNYACNYYIANHDTRTIFWLDSVDAKTFPVWWEVKGVTSPTHIAFSEHAIVSFYWYHCHLFPHSYKLTTEAVDGLRDILMHAFCDAITSTTSTVPYSLTDMEKMILLSNNLRKNPGTGGVSALSRLMYIFARLRFVHFHGQPAARLDRDQSVHEEAWKRNRRPWWMKWLSPVFFSTPDLYYRILLGIWVDDLVHESSWAEFMDKMRNEWQQLALFNTVLLNANVAFLAIQSIDNSSNSPGRSPAQIASFLSTVASFGSIILGLLLANTHRAKAEDSAGSVARIFGSWGRSNRPGLATLAFLYGVPYALLLWGLVCFFVAFSAMCYIDSDVFVRSLVSSAWFVIVMLGLWCATVLSDWDHHDSWQEESFWSYAGDVLPLLWSGLQYVIDGIIKISAFSWQSLHTQQMSVRVDDRPPIESEDGNARKRLNPTVTSDVQIEITVIEP